MNYYDWEPDKNEIDRLIERGKQKRILETPRSLLKIIKYPPDKIKNGGVGALFSKLPDGTVDEITVIGGDNLDRLLSVLAANGYQGRPYEVVGKLKQTVSEPFGGSRVLDKGTVPEMADSERKAVLNGGGYKIKRKFVCINCGKHTGSSYPQKRRCDRCNRQIETERVRRGRAEGKYS